MAAAQERYEEAVQLLVPPVKVMSDGREEDGEVIRRTLQLNAAQCALKRSKWHEAARLCDDVLDAERKLAHDQKVKAASVRG